GCGPVHRARSYAAITIALAVRQAGIGVTQNAIVVNTLAEGLQCKIGSGPVLDVMKVHRQLAGADVAGHDVRTGASGLPSRGTRAVAGPGPGHHARMGYRAVYGVDVERNTMRRKLVHNFAEKGISGIVVMSTGASMAHIVELHAVGIAIGID